MKKRRKVVIHSCAGCGHSPARKLRGLRWSCDVCARLSVYKWESLVEEWARISLATPP